MIYPADLYQPGKNFSQVDAERPSPTRMTDRAVLAALGHLDRPAPRGAPALLLAFAGPAVVASVGYMDPGNFATNIQAGANSATRFCG